MIQKIKNITVSRAKYISKIIYGTIITLGLIVTLEKSNLTGLEIIISILGTLLVIAIAEYYVNSLTLAAKLKRVLKTQERIDIAKKEFAIMFSSEVPIMIFLLEVFNIITLKQAFLYSQIVGILILFFFGFIITKIFEKGLMRRIIVGSITALLGVAIVSLKLLFK
jgi:VIT1/CCC1 family predicted Fe2+/Mn2+ transporter